METGNILLRKPDMQNYDRYANQQYNPTHKPKPYGSFRYSFSAYLVACAVGFGILLVLLNVYQLYSLSWRGEAADIGLSNHLQRKNKIVWIYAKKSSHLKHVIRVFSYAGYSVITSVIQPKQWDVMWAYEFPFKAELKDTLTNLHFDQMVNHLPGTGYVTLKVELAKTKLRWIPTAFSIPEEKEQFILEAERSPKKLWVQKSNHHRGIKIVNSKEVDLTAKSTFVQEFVTNPLLIDKKKFDIGVYVVYTSVDPLQVYIYDDEMLIRFCMEDYYPLDVKNVNKYVVGDKYIPVPDMASLKNNYNQGKMTFKDALFTYMKDIGYDTKQIWEEIRNCISEVFLAKAQVMSSSFNNYATKHNFFELVRVDFVIDESGKVWLMEINMSPNLSSNSHAINALLYQQVIYNTLALVGIASHIDERFSVDAKDMSANERSIIVANSKCKDMACLYACDVEECQLCNHCMTDANKEILKKAYREHYNKGGFSRALPLPMKANSAEVINVNSRVTRPSDVYLALWFREKCKLQPAWCQ